MPTRFVTAPKAHVYTRNTRDSEKGVTYKLTPWIVSGRVERKINQVSSAEVTLRNPQRRFTSPSKGVSFYPMDPITIYLERIPGYPVRVFTGYLDETPYFQLYPGTITLKASCTLKKLLYTYFDPSLPMVIAWLAKYGWAPTGDGSLLNYAALDTPLGGNNTSAKVGPSGQTSSGGGGTDNIGKQLQDPSLGKLIWASLYEMASWQDSYIYVEQLPDGIIDRVDKLLKAIAGQTKSGADEFTYFLKQVLQSSQGTGSGTQPTGGTVAAGSLPCVVHEAASKYGIPPETLWGVAGMETTFGKNVTTSSAQAMGVFQFIKSTAAQYNYPYTNATDPDTIAKQGDAAAHYLSDLSKSHGGDWNAALEAYSGNGYGLSQVQSQASSNPLPACNQSSTTGSTTTSTSTSSQSGSTAPATNTSSPTTGQSALANIFPYGTKIVVERADAGVDFSAPDGVPIGAMASGTIGHKDGWYNGQPFLRVDLDAPIGNYNAWYIAEGIKITVADGTHVNAGQQIAVTESHNSGIETGWAQRGALQYPGFAEGAPIQAGTDFANYIGVTPGSGPLDWSKLKPGSNTGGTATGSGATATANTSREDATAGAFVGAINFPTAEDMTMALALGAQHKGLMHDQSLMPWVQQLTQGSLRSFQSLPDGSFYAFYPDYFGEFGHHDAYWEIKDIEIMDGGVSLSDDALFTHVFAIGENVWPSKNEYINKIFQSGTINIFNAYQVGLTTSDNSPVISSEEAVQFIKRYGARPLVKEYPMVRSNIFETLLAYQEFLSAWSNQFKTPFQFTFMPEIYPGGKVAFPEHGLQMYIDSVVHSWDYENAGFTTDAQLSAPSLINPKDDPAKWDLPSTFIRAMIEPLKQPGAPTLTQQEKQLVQQIDKSQAPLLSQQPPWLEGPSTGSPLGH